MRPSLLTAMLAGALGLGCSDHPGVTDPRAGAGPSFQAEISRFEQPLVIDFVLGGGQELTALVGVSFEELDAFCTGADPEQLVDAMVVSHPTRDDGTVEHRLIGSQEMSATVWATAGNFCELRSTQPLAVGTVRVMTNDNEGDFFLTGPGANAFTLRFQGTLANPETGQRYQLQGAVRIVVLPDNTFTFPPVPFLRLTPLGQ